MDKQELCSEYIGNLFRLSSSLTHPAGNAEYPPGCSHDLLTQTQLQWRILEVPEDQEGQVALGHLENQEDLVVQQK